MPQPTAFSYLNIHNPVNDAIGSVGGLVRRFTASGTLLVGDAVYLSAANTVAKSATAANYVGFVGFVVGGSSLSPTMDVDPTVAVGTTASLTTTDVYVRMVLLVESLVQLVSLLVLISPPFLPPQLLVVSVPVRLLASRLVRY